MVRVVLGVLAALLAAFLGVAVVELISYAVHPPPEGLDPTDTAQLQAYLATVPAGVMALIAVAHGVGALLGGLAGTAVGGRRAGTAFAVIFVVITVLNLFSLPHPAWFWVLDLVLTVGGVAGGIALGLRRAAG